MRNLHTVKPDDVLALLQSSQSGMPKDSPKGENRIFPEQPRRMTDYLMPLFVSPLLILFAITVLAAFLAEEAVLGYVALVSLFVACYVWYYAYRYTLDSLDRARRFADGFCRVIRDGTLCLVPSEDLVVGDVLLLQKGDFVPADCRILYSTELVASEGALFHKKGRYISKSAERSFEGEIADSHNMLWAGSVIAEGSATVAVFCVGENTRLASLAEKEKSEVMIGGELATYFKTLSLIASSVLLGMLFLVALLGFTPFSQNGLFRDWLLFASLGGTASLELFGLILTVASGRALGKARGAFFRRPRAIEPMSRLDIAIVSARAFRDESLDGVHTLLLPHDGGTLVESVENGISAEGERLLRNAIVALGGTSRLMPQKEGTSFGRTLGDHLTEAFDKAGLSYREASYSVLYASEHRGISFGIFRRDGEVLIALCGDAKALFSYVGSVYEKSTIRPVTKDDVVTFARSDAIGVAIGVLGVDPDRVSDTDDLFCSLEGSLVYEGSLLLTYGMRDIRKTAEAFSSSKITLVVATEQSEETRRLISMGAKPFKNGEKGLLYWEKPTRRALYDMIKGARESGATVAFEGWEPSHLPLMREADVSLSFGDVPKARTLIQAEKASPELLSHGADATRLFADCLVSGDVQEIAKAKGALRTAFFAAQSAVLYLVTVLLAKLLPAVFSIVSGNAVVTPLFFILMGFGFDTLAVFSLIFRQGERKRAPYSVSVMTKRLIASLGVGALTGGAILIFSLIVSRYFSLSAEIFSTLSLLSVSLVFFLWHYAERDSRPSASLGTALTVGGVILIFILLFSRGSFGKMGLVFFLLGVLLAAVLEIVSHVILVKKTEKR